MRNPTTRRYPRTLNEAFRDADYANAIEGPTPGPGDAPIVFAGAVIAAFVLLVVYINLVNMGLWQ